MSVALLKESALVPLSGLGPYRRSDYESLTGEPLCELIFGRFYWSSSPSVLHQIVVGYLWQELNAAAEANRGAGHVRAAASRWFDWRKRRPR